METTPVKRVTRASRKRVQNSITNVELQGPVRKKRIKDQPSLTNQAIMDQQRKENASRLATSVSVGLTKIPTRLCCKENLASGPVNCYPCPKTEPMSPGLESPLQSSHPVYSVPHSALHCPLPPLPWVQSPELWARMRAKDSVKAAPEAELQLRHPGIVPSMRVILLDWMLEVCEEYRLHRETYYLSKDMLDRFMDQWTGILKDQLQLLGVTCLFIAAKIEEIYPPKLGEFAYVTDGACTVANIVEMELIICKTLKWRLNHSLVTANSWVSMYAQLASHCLRPSGLMERRDFELPAFSSLEFIKVMQLLDLCTLDMNSRQYGSSVLAASALFLVSERSRLHFTLITGLEVSDIRGCIGWMHPFAVAYSHNSPMTQKTFTGVSPQDSHNIQTHDVSIAMLEESHELANRDPLPLPHQESSVFMTPPRSERRCLAPVNTC